MKGLVESLNENTRNLSDIGVYTPELKMFSLLLKAHNINCDEWGDHYPHEIYFTIWYKDGERFFNGSQSEWPTPYIMFKYNQEDGCLYPYTPSERLRSSFKNALIAYGDDGEYEPIKITKQFETNDNGGIELTKNNAKLLLKYLVTALKEMY